MISFPTIVKCTNIVTQNGIIKYTILNMVDYHEFKITSNDELFKLLIDKFSRCLKCRSCNYYGVMESNGDIVKCVDCDGKGVKLI